MPPVEGADSCKRRPPVDGADSCARMPPGTSSSSSVMTPEISDARLRNQAQTSVTRGAIVFAPSDSFIPDDQDIADYGSSGGDDLEDTTGTYVIETCEGENMMLTSTHVDIKFKYRKGENDEESMSCFGRIAPNGETSFLTQYLSWARATQPTFSTKFRRPNHCKNGSSGTIL